MFMEQQKNGTWTIVGLKESEIIDIEEKYHPHKAYYCDPKLNTECKKCGCQIYCFHTTRKEFGLLSNEQRLFAH